jgi:hypothetical protein
MTGKAYYITTLADWQRHAARFANSHWLALDPCARSENTTPAPDLNGLVGAQHDAPGADAWHCFETSEPILPEEIAGKASIRQESLPGAACCAPTGEIPARSVNADAKILVLIEADEGVHLSLEDDPAFEALPHPLAQKPISDAVQSALAPHGVAPGATTFDAAEAVARVHPLLRHRVF